MARVLGLLAFSVGLAPAAGAGDLCPNETVWHGSTWPTRYWSSGCAIPVSPNPSRVGAINLTVAVMSPYSGALGDTMTASEPFIEMAAREIEGSGLLAGYRLNVELIDSKCSRIHTSRAVVRSLYPNSPKHAFIGDSCSGCCEAINTAIEAANILQFSPNCIADSLSDLTQYPYFTRFSPAWSLQIDAMYSLLEMLPWRRFGIICGPQSPIHGGREEFLRLANRDEPTYHWKVLFTDFTDIAQPGTAPTTALAFDARIILFFVYEDLGVQVVCSFAKQGLFSPDYISIQFSGWWNSNFLDAWVTPCTRDELWRGAFGMIGVNRGGATASVARHGLSGRRVQDILDEYTAACSSFAGGLGACNLNFSPYFYDTLWHVASTLHDYLVLEGHTPSELLSTAGRQRMFELSKVKDYLGITGQLSHNVRGDRVGSMMLWQNGRTVLEFLGYLQPAGTDFVRPLYWDPDNSNRSVMCSLTSCNSSGSWIPADRPAACPPGRVWDDLLGCSACEAGRYAAPGASSCESCNLGMFSNESGRSSCTPCFEGTFSKLTGMSECSPCEVGSFVDTEGASECRYCGRGTYADTEGLTRCRQCLDLPNPLPATKNVASRKASDCACNAGTYLASSGNCKTCLQGLVCPVGATEAGFHSTNGSSTGSHRKVEEGFYITRTDPLSPYKCLHSHQCPGGDAETCSPHHQDLTCGACEDGYYMSTGGWCKRCSMQFPVALLAAIPLVVGPPGVLLLTYFHKGDQEIWNLPLEGFWTIVFIAVVYCQTIAIIIKANVEFPSNFVSATGFTAFTIDPFAVFHMECFGLGNFSLAMIMRTLLPLWGAVIFGLAYVWNRAIRVCRPSFPHLFDALISKYGNYYLMLFMGIVKEAVALFACTDHPNGKASLRSASHILCREDLWNSLVGVSIAGLIIFGILPIALFGFLLIIARKKYQSKSFRIRTKFLNYRFRTEYGFWSLVMLVKGLWVTLAVVLFVDGALQVLWMATGLLFYTVATARIRPFRAMSASSADLVGHVCVLFAIFLCCELADVSDRDGNGQMAYSAVVVAFVFFIVCLAWQARLMFWEPQRHDYNLAQAEALSETLSFLTTSTTQVANVLDNLSGYEILVLRQAAHVIAREVGRHGALRACQSSIRQENFDGALYRANSATGTFKAVCSSLSRTIRRSTHSNMEDRVPRDGRTSVGSKAMSVMSEDDGKEVKDNEIASDSARLQEADDDSDATFQI